MRDPKAIAALDRLARDPVLSVRRNATKALSMMKIPG
jgi:hypothetical protein